MRKTLTDIQYEYDTKRNKCLSMAYASEHKVYSDHPEIRRLISEIDDIRLNSLITAAKYTTRSEEIFAEANDKVEKKRKELSSLLADFGISEDFNKPKFNCERCEDTGYITVDNAKALCPCMLIRLRTQVYGCNDPSSVTGSFEGYDLSIFTSDAQRDMARKLYNFGENYCMGNGKLFTLFEGKAGLGKSFLMEAIAKRLNNDGKDVAIISAYNLFECFKLHRLGELNMLSPVTRADYLMIDDLGMEPSTRNITREYFFNLIETRSNLKKKTIITTNLTLLELVERYGEKVVSRLQDKDRSDAIYFEGNDLRVIRA